MAELTRSNLCAVAMDEPESRMSSHELPFLPDIDGWNPFP